MKRVGTKEEYDVWGTVRLAWLEFILRRDGVINTESFSHQWIPALLFWQWRVKELNNPSAVAVELKNKVSLIVLFSDFIRKFSQMFSQ